MSIEQRRKISIANTGKTINDEQKARLRLMCKNRPPQSQETIKKRTESIRKITITPEYRKKMSEVLKGKPKSVEAVAKRSGANHYNWKGGVTPGVKKVRNSKEYKIWRKAVFERDDYTCVWCGKRGNDLNADHIKPFALYPELRLAIDNGRTLCVPCHKTTFKYAKK